MSNEQAQAGKKAVLKNLVGELKTEAATPWPTIGRIVVYRRDFGFGVEEFPGIVHSCTEQGSVTMTFFEKSGPIFAKDVPHSEEQISRTWGWPTRK